jgi:hypothetical protein
MYRNTEKNREQFYLEGGGGVGGGLIGTLIHERP